MLAAPVSVNSLLLNRGMAWGEREGGGEEGGGRRGGGWVEGGRATSPSGLSLGGKYFKTTIKYDDLLYSQGAVTTPREAWWAPVLVSTPHNGYIWRRSFCWS